MTMSLRNMFISLMESSRNAEELLRVHGPADPNTVYAFEKHNEQKREFLDRLEELENLVEK